MLPTGSVAPCTVLATAADPTPAPNDTDSLGFDTVTVATGPPAPSATEIQAQTRGAAEVLNDFDYFLQVTCPGA